MKEEFQLPDPTAAQTFIRRFSPEAQRRGHAKFGEGAVENLIAVEPGQVFSATVRDSAWRNEVRLSHDASGGWTAQCTCPLGSNCAHVYAAMSAVLAEHRMTLVRQLSTGQARSSESIAALKARPEPVLEQSLAERLKKVTGRPLSQQAQRFLRQLKDVYVRCSQKQSLNYWDFQQLGFALPAHHFDPIRLWPAPPKNEYEFWSYVAHFVHDQGVQIPEFMMPVTDFSEIKERVSRWRRHSEIEKWKRTFSLYQPTAPDKTIPGEVDLQVILQGGVARLHWRGPDQEQFEPLRQNQYRQLEADYHSGAIHFNPEAELIWQLFSRPLSYGIRLELGTRRPELMQALNRLLRSPALASRVFSGTGKPLTRVAEPLRWELTAMDSGDYSVRLVQSDGSPAPEILCVLAGSPWLYVAEEQIFSGPEPMDTVLDLSGENLIPAPAVEQSSGLSFLQALGCQLPEALRARIHTLPYRVEISCWLAPAYPGAGTEECLFKVLAQAPDGREVFWDGYSWQEKRAGRERKTKSSSEITLYDTRPLTEAVGLLENLNLRPAHQHKALSLRLTKKFGETMSNWLKTVPPGITVKLDGELASLTSSEVAGKVKLEATEKEIDWFDLRVVLDVADTTLTPAEVKLLLNAKGAFVRLKGKGWRRLQYDLTEEENERLARLGLSPRELSAEPQRLHALQLADEAAKKFLPQVQVEQIQRRATEIKARVAPALPAGVQAQLRPYQLEGYHFLAYLSSNRFGGILADDMGLGKTLQTLAWLAWLRGGGEEARASANQPVLVVCPKSVMDNWQAEASRFVPALRVKVWSASRLPQLQNELADADVHVLNYNQLRLLGESLSTVQWLAVVLDEGQYVKNPGSQTAQVARGLKANHRLVLSGTPIENRLLDLWSLMAFAMPGVLGGRSQFGKLYDDRGDTLARRRLAARVRPFLLRRTKTEVAKDLPDRIEEDLFCEMEGEQQTLYRAELKSAQQLLLKIKSQKELAQQQFNFLTSLLRLRQICCHPRLIQPGFEGTSAKCDSLLEQLEPLMEEGQKVLVFSQFVQMLDLLRPSLEERNWPVFYLAGQTENRGELVERFQKADGAAVFLISLKAGGFGLNLTAASYVVLFDPWWNPAVENQAIDRTHRIGQSNKVIAYRLLIKNSIEEKIRALQKQKRTLVEDVLGEEKFAKSLTLEDLQFLLAG